jgi:hypothetical protein
MSADVVRSRLPDSPAPAASFSQRLAELASKIEFRRADSDEDREAIFRLRYQAYMREGAITSNAAARFADEDDETDNAYLIGLHIDGELAASMRLHVASKKGRPDCPSLHVFPDILQPMIDAGQVILDPTRFVADEKLSRLHRGLPLVTIRASVMATEYFGGDHLLAAVRTEHRAFYMRSFNSTVLCDARPYPQLLKPICLTDVDFPKQRADLYRRYPFWRSTPAERRKLFERSPRNAVSANAPPALQLPHGAPRPFAEHGLTFAAG